MASKAQIIALAEHGLSRATIAQRTRVSESYISQVLAENELKQKSLAAQLAVLDERTQRDAKYDSIEDKLLRTMDRLANTLYKPQDVLKALMAINKAERRGATSQQLAEIANNQQTSVIPLQLPERIKLKITKSSKHEVLAVNGRALVTKDSKLLLQEMEAELEPTDPRLALATPNGLELLDPDSADKYLGASEFKAELLEAHEEGINTRKEPTNENPAQTTNPAIPYEDQPSENFPESSEANGTDELEILDPLQI